MSDEIAETRGDLTSRLTRAREQLERRGQVHVLRWWPELRPLERHTLLCQIEAIPWTALDPIMESHVRRAPVHRAHGSLSPPNVFPAHPDSSRAKEYEEYRRRGEELLRLGEVAAFTVAGGQGTRLGISGPKGLVPVTPVRNKTLFQLFAEMVLAARRRYRVEIPWYIMTSPANDEATRAYFHDQGYFGLPEEDVWMFPQGVLPAFDLAGRLLMDSKHSISLAPDGHGGSLKALVGSGAIDDMERREISFISYFQVDNPLVQPFDPLFLGLHVATRSEMSTKAARKAHDLEKVGNLCVEDGKLKVIEYTEMPEELARQKNPDSTRKFDAANLAIHLFDVDFVARVAEAGLPIRRAEKAIPHLDDQGKRVEPKSPSAIKLETFVFDVLPMARSPMLLEVDRTEEFSPVKNAAGADSLETARWDQIERACRWLATAGTSIPRDATGSCQASVEISPLWALDARETAAKAAQIPPIRAGECTYLE